jgi:hypothetical protein
MRQQRRNGRGIEGVREWLGGMIGSLDGFELVLGFGRAGGEVEAPFVGGRWLYAPYFEWRSGRVEMKGFLRQLEGRNFHVRHE